MLSKDVCRRCWYEDDSLTLGDEKRRQRDFKAFEHIFDERHKVLCPYSKTKKAAESAPVNVQDPPPAWCPYKQEHAKSEAKVCAVAVEGTHIKFVPAPPKPKTKVWWVVNKYENNCIGNIGWFGRWRKYSFFPKSDTVFEEVCLREIANFCEKETQEHRKQRRNKHGQG